MAKRTGAQITDVFRQLLEEHPLYRSSRDPGSMISPTAFLDAANRMWRAQPGTLSAWADIWQAYQTDTFKLWSQMIPTPGAKRTPVIEAGNDPRFKDESWSDNPFYDFIKQSYLLSVRAIVDTADKAQLPAKEQRRLSFYARLATDALAPSNFASTNPKVLARAVETKGQSLIDGFRHMLDDLQKGYISTTDESAFEVGKNLATTEGAVIYRNDLIELIQYKPRAEMVSDRPLVIVPPCVNKFYIFDLNERKSMIRYALEQERNVFIISWRNPGPKQRDWNWDKYVQDGVFRAFEVAQAVAKAEKVDAVAWCNGGTLMTVALAVMSKEQRGSIASATLLSSMIDFSDPGEIEVFLDPQGSAQYDRKLGLTGVLPGKELAQAMAMLHANESIWNFVVNNYLMGQAPAPFDVLYWNSDTSNLPAEWYRYYAENMYQANKLREPGGLTILGKPVDTHQIDVPCYMLAGLGDHIVPWRTSYLARDLVGGDVEFVLTDGGHVSGTVINHPVKNRRHFFVGGKEGAGPDAWKETAEHHEGSWWPHWLQWLDQQGGAARIPAPTGLGDEMHPALAPAPGTYVLESVPQRY